MRTTEVVILYTKSDPGTPQFWQHTSEGHGIVELFESMGLCYRSNAGDVRAMEVYAVVVPQYIGKNPEDVTQWISDVVYDALDNDKWTRIFRLEVDRYDA